MLFLWLSLTSTRSSLFPHYVLGVQRGGFHSHFVIGFLRSVSILCVYHLGSLWCWIYILIRTLSYVKCCGGASGVGSVFSPVVRLRPQSGFCLQVAAVVCLRMRPADAPARSRCGRPSPCAPRPPCVGRRPRGLHAHRHPAGGGCRLPPLSRGDGQSPRKLRATLAKMLESRSSETPWNIPAAKPGAGPTPVGMGPSLNVGPFFLWAREMHYMSFYSKGILKLFPEPPTPASVHVTVHWHVLMRTPGILSTSLLCSRLLLNKGEGEAGVEHLQDFLFFTQFWLRSPSPAQV